MKKFSYWDHMPVEFLHEQQIMLVMRQRENHRISSIEDTCKEIGIYLRGRTEEAVKTLYDNELIYVWHKAASWCLTVEGDYYVSRWTKYYEENPF